MPSHDEDFGSGILEDLLSDQTAEVSAAGEAPIVETPPAKKPAAPEDQFAELEDLFEGDDGEAAAPAEAVAETPDGQQPAAPLYDQNQIARAALIGVSANEFLSWPADQIESRLTAAEQFVAFQNHYRQQAAIQAQQAEQANQQPAAPPVFDEAKVRKELSEKYEEAMVDDLVEAKRTAHAVKLVQLENERLQALLVQQQQTQQQQNAARAYNDWNAAIEASVSRLDPSIQEVAKDAQKLTAIQQRTMELGAMYTASGRPIPSAEQLAKDAAFALFGDEIVAVAKGTKKGGPMSPEKFSRGTTARTRPSTAPAFEGTNAAIAGIAQTSLFKKLNGLN